MINKAFLELMIAGDSQGKPFTFPIPTYGMTKDVLNKNDEVTKLLYTLAAKFGSPNFQNYIGSGNDPSDVRSMCCRLSLDIKKLKSRGLWNMGNKTGSLGVCTINLNHCAKDGESKFLENIDIAYDLSVEELLIKHGYIMEAFNKGLLPFTKQYLDNKDPFKSFFHTIGDVGMNEACINMFDSSIEQNQDFTVEILKHLRSRTDETTEETGILHNLEETPMEGGTRRLAKLDKKLGLPTQGKDEPYLTNSTHCPVDTQLDWIQNIRVQEKFKPHYSGGTIVHGFIGEQISPKSAEYLIKQMSLETKIPYYNLTPTFSMCKTHKDISGNVPICPKCGEETIIYSRVVGYLQPTIKWNESKREEFKDRKMYNVTLI
jgi:anaerobic ribonucleoside-triphosphate reductase